MNILIVPKVISIFNDFPKIIKNYRSFVFVLLNVLILIFLEEMLLQNKIPIRLKEDLFESFYMKYLFQ